MILSQSVLDALEALGNTANHEASTNNMINFYPGDLVHDVRSILEHDGAPFMWAAHTHGTFMVPMDDNVAKGLLDVQHAYGKLDWYVWDGTFDANRRMRRVLPVGGKLITDVADFRQK